MQDQRAMDLIGNHWPSDDVREWAEIPPQLHNTVMGRLAGKIDAHAGVERPVLILMTGAGGVGKTAVLDQYLARISDEKSDESRALNTLAGTSSEHRLKGDSFVRLSHGLIKEELFRLGGADHIPQDWWNKLDDDGRKELGDVGESHRYRQDSSRFGIAHSAIHTESSWLMERVADKCMQDRRCLAYDVSAVEKRHVEHVLWHADHHGYKAIVMSVEGSKEQAHRGNYRNWQKNGELSVSGGESLGHAVSPMWAIESAYQGRTDQSKCRRNAIELVAGEHRWAHAIIRVDDAWRPRMKLESRGELKKILAQRENAVMAQAAALSFPATSALASIFRQGPPTESVDPFAFRS
ncbi:hypothetical protein ACIBL8_48305 [Streptomyces sp. NPDC050523]|uniref:hypothetical protein n=1 Tax=Streptomyces sp. NPDC050523 TaxID=3365622 RepID=UPI003793BA64